MAIRKNKKRIDPRYFLHETTYRDEIEEDTTHRDEIEEGFTTNMPDNIPTTADVMQKMRDDGTAPDEEPSPFSAAGSSQGPLTTDDLFTLFRAGVSPDELRDVDNANLSPEMKSILGRPV